MRFVFSLLYLDVSPSSIDYARLMAEGTVPGFLLGIVSSLGGWYFRRMVGSFGHLKYHSMH